MYKDKRRRSSNKLLMLANDRMVPHALLAFAAFIRAALPCTPMRLPHMLAKLLPVFLHVTAL
jgi:hypothetical protein